MVVDTSARKWKVTRKRKIDTLSEDGFKPCLERALNIEAADKCVNTLLKEGLHTELGWMDIPLPNRVDQQERIRHFIKNRVLEPFLLSYVGEFGFIFEETNFNVMFQEWLKYASRTEQFKRVLILRNLSLQGMDSMEIGGYKIRMLNASEVESLLILNAYNLQTQHTTLVGLPLDDDYDLDPTFCVEFPPLVFGADQSTNRKIEENKLKLLTFFRLFRDQMITGETELTTRTGLLAHSGPPLASASMRPSELMIPYSQKYILRGEDIERLQNLFLKYDKIDFEEFRSFRTASKRYGLFLGRYSPEDWLIDCLIAFEALLLPDGQNELRYRLSLRVAFFIGKSHDERRKIFEITQFAYDLRSSIVHGDEIEKDKNDNRLKQLGFDSIYSFIDEVRKNLRGVMLEMIEVYNRKNSEPSKPSEIQIRLVKDIDSEILKPNIP